MHGRFSETYVVSVTYSFGCRELVFDWSLGCVRHSVVFFFSSRRRHTRCLSDWSSDVCSSDLRVVRVLEQVRAALLRELVRLALLFRLRRVLVLWLNRGSRRGDTQRATRAQEERKKAGSRSEERRVGKEGRFWW